MLRGCGLLASHPTVFFGPEGVQPAGFDREVLDGFVQQHKVRLEVVRVPNWADLLPALLAGKGDLIAGGYSDTAARRKQIAFSAEVFPTRIVVVTLGPPRSQAFGVRQEDRALKRALDEHVGALRRSAKWGRLVGSYFGDAALDILRTMRKD